MSNDILHRFCAKIGVRNNVDKPRIVAVEPWAEDFTLLPGEELEVLAFGERAMPWFKIDEWNDTTQIYCEDTAGFKVMQGDQELQCGHNRQTGQREK